MKSSFWEAEEQKLKRIAEKGPFSIWLLKMLKIHGCTQNDLANEIGISRASISSWINGRAKPSKVCVIAICKVFGIDDHETPWQYVKEQFGE